MRRIEPLWIFPLAKLVLHLVTIRGYGLFRDEYYYVACSKQLAFGYVDHPPLSLLLLAIARGIFGDSLVAIRLWPALIGALTVLLVGLIVREFGGRRFAQSLAMTAVGLNYLFVFHYFSMNCFDVLVWTSTAYLMIRIATDDDAARSSGRLWIVLGVVLGLGLENKVSVLWLGAGLAVGLLATGERRWLVTRWPWIAGAIAMTLFVPHVVWQVIHDWPTAEFIRNATSDKMVEVAPAEFVRGQLEMFSPATVPLWLSGLVFLFVLRRGARFRLLGWVYVTVFAILMLSGSSRTGYLLATYTWLLAAGAAAWESWLGTRRWARVVVFAVVALSSVLTLPLSLPVLQVEQYIRYAEAAGVAPSTAERKELAELPQHYADMFGWRELVDGVDAAYRTLSPEERAVATIFTFNYGNSGAIDYHAADRGLPQTLSGHNNYWLWGPRGFTGEVVIVVGASRETLAHGFDSVERAGTVRCEYCMPYENDKPVWIARGSHRSLEDRWSELKHFD